MEKKSIDPWLLFFLGKLKRINVTLYLVKKYFLAQMILEKFQSKLIPFYRAVNERWLWLFAVNGIIRNGLFIFYCLFLFLFISPGVLKLITVRRNLIKWITSAAKPRIEKWWRIWTRKKRDQNAIVLVYVFYKCRFSNFAKSMFLKKCSGGFKLCYDDQLSSGEKKESENWFLINGVLMFQHVLWNLHSFRDKFTLNRHLSLLNCTRIYDVFSNGDFYCWKSSNRTIYINNFQYI